MNKNSGDKVAGDGIEKTSGPRKRAGHTLERVAKASASNAPHEVIALQLSINSGSGNKYEASEIPTLIKVYQDSKRKVGLTKAQAQMMIAIQHGIEADEAADVYPEMVSKAPNATKL